MSRIYSTTNRIRFTDIPEKYAVPRQFRAKQSEVHSAVIVYVYSHYKDTKKYRQLVVDALNRLTYCVMEGQAPLFEWKSTDPLATMPDIELDIVEGSLGDFYLTPEAIEWDVTPSDDAADNVIDQMDISASDEKSNHKNKTSNKKSSVPNKEQVQNRPLQQIKEQQRNEVQSRIMPTPKEDLYIQPPRFPRFDVNQVWMSATVGDDNLVIYKTLPEIPTKQNEISITTVVDKMTTAELFALYPNRVIHTRLPEMYKQYDSMDYDENLGCIIPIEGFTKEQVVDNIIRYPHLFRIRRMSEDGKLEPFFSHIEIDGKILPIGEVWDSLPESKLMPRENPFVKEYVIRRYLLERDNGVQHKSDIFGTLDPFLTLFMPYTEYINYGYKDTTAIVKQCVMSRVSYKQSRSPVLRRMESHV